MGSANVFEKVLRECGVSSKRIRSIFEIAEEEIGVDALRQKATKKYLTFFNHYVWYTILCAFLAMIGLALTIENWERTFKEDFRHPVSINSASYIRYAWVSNELQLVCLASTLICIFVCYHKHKAKQVYQQFNDPLVLYKQIVLAQIKIGVIDEEAATDNFHSSAGKFISVMKDTRFWIEVFLLLLMPYPDPAILRGV